MRGHVVRLSFDVPVEEHTILKMECADARISIKDFLQDWVIKGIHELHHKQLHQRLKKSIKQAKEGKVKSRGSFAKYVDDEV